MSKKSLLAVILSLVFIATSVSAQPNNSPKSFELPPNATEVAQNVFSLGKAYDKDVDGMVEGYAFVHKKANVKSTASSRRPSGNTCYAYLATGAKWKTQESWLMNPSNTSGLDENTLFTNEALNIQKWESAAAYNIFGNGASTPATLVADETATDGLNEVYFGPITDANTIAVTIVWGIFSGPAKNRVLVEWDQIFNTNFNWSLAGEANKMDFENISTHEVGHAVGMGHPSSTCTEETMYAYGNNGETKKRDLNTGDIAGISALY